MKYRVLFYFFFLLLLLFSFKENKSSALRQFNVYNKELRADKKTPAFIVLEGDTLHGKMKHRGGGSKRFYKKSYTFKFDSNLALQEGNNNAYRTWILNASYIDKTLMRHRLNYELFQSFNSTYKTALCEYITVSYNDSYDGIYLLMEKLGSKKLAVEENNGGCIFKDCNVFRRDTILEEEKNNYYHQKSPEIEEFDFNSYMDSLRRIMLIGTKEEFNKMAIDQFDIANIMDWHLLLMFSNNGDGVIKNFYLYRERDKAKFKIAPWDYDHTYGRDADNELNLFYTESIWQRNMLLDRLYNEDVEGYKLRIAKRWKELRDLKLISEETLFAKIQQYKNEMGSEIEQNFEKWPAASHFYYDYNTFEQEIVIMKHYISKRLTYLDFYFSRQL